MIWPLFAIAIGVTPPQPTLRTTKLNVERVSTPMKFERRLILCNAYPSSSLATIKHNGLPLASRKGVAFNECRYVEGAVKEKDKIDFSFDKLGIEGTFEVGELPMVNALLLLIVQKRDERSQLLSFQSFAFPTTSGENDAQIAVIDTFKSTTGQKPKLRMEDHRNESAKQKSARRVEELFFNRVYAIEPGYYDMFIPDNKKPTSIHLNKGEDYVVLRTGDGNHYAVNLVAFPNSATSSWTFLAFLVILLQ